MAIGIIDFTSERERHEQLLGRQDVLAELDRLLRGGGVSRGWVLVKGGPGMGKSALLSHYLSRLEAQERAVPHHFLRRGVEDWDRPEVVRENLAARVEALFPEQAVSDARPESRLREVLQRVSQEVLVPRRARLILVLDGLDEAESDAGGANPLQRFLPHALPRGVWVLCASRPTYPHLAWLEARDGVHCIDLDDAQWAPSNETVVQQYWERAAPDFMPPLEPGFVAEAVRRAGGNVLYAVKLAEWLREQPVEQRRAEQLPRGLKAFLEELWQGVQAQPREPPDRGARWTRPGGGRARIPALVGAGFRGRLGRGRGGAVPACREATAAGGASTLVGGAGLASISRVLPRLHPVAARARKGPAGSIAVWRSGWATGRWREASRRSAGVTPCGTR